MSNRLGFPIEPILDNLEEALDALVKGIRRSAPLSIAKNSFSKEHFIKEFRTIKFCLPRSSGNTALALRLFHKYPESILITNDIEAKKRLIEDLITIDGNRQWSEDRIFSYRQLSDTMGDGRIGDRGKKICIIDMASCIEKHRMDVLYNLAFEFYILIG